MKNKKWLIELFVFFGIATIITFVWQLIDYIQFHDLQKSFSDTIVCIILSQLLTTKLLNGGDE